MVPPCNQWSTQCCSCPCDVGLWRNCGCAVTAIALYGCGRPAQPGAIDREWRSQVEVASPVELLALVVAATASTAMQLLAEIPSARGQYASKVDLLIRAVIGHSKGGLHAIVQIQGGDCTYACQGSGLRRRVGNGKIKTGFN